MKTIGIGIIGLGGISHKHISELLACPEARIVAICDIDPAKIAEKNEKLCLPKEKCYTDYRDLIADGEVDAVFSNPPYMRTDTGKRNGSDYKYIARHEVFGGIEDFCAAGYRLLRHGGYFYCVFRPDRLSELVVAMEHNRLAIKSMTFVQAHASAEPSMVLVRAIKGGANGMTVTAPLLLSCDAEGGQMSARARQIYDTMSFEEAKEKREE